MFRRRTTLSLAAAALGLVALGGCGSSEPAPATSQAGVATAPTPAPSQPNAPTAEISEIPETPATPETPEQATAAGAYITYDTYRKNPAAATGRVVLFFHAGWCPTCQEAERNLTSSPVPGGLTVVKVDFDHSSNLRQRYGVTVQHTFVQVDPSGAQLAKWSGSSDAAAILGKTV